MKQINRNNTKKLKSLIGLTNNKNLIKQSNKYSNYLGFKSLNITPNVHFEEWSEIAKKGIVEKNKWYYDSEDVEKEETQQEKKRNYFSEDDSLDEEWENNYRFKLGKNWVDHDEDVSSGQEKMSHKRSYVEMFYSPAVNEFLPKETERLQHFTIEDVPEDITKDDVNEVLSKLINEECVSIEKFKTYKKTNLFVELKSKSMKADFLNPSRLNFGIWLKGKRCDVYDSLKRQRNVFLAKIPRTSNDEEIKTFVNKIMQQEVEVTVNKPENNSYCFIEFNKHSNAANFIERINIIGDQYANWGKNKNNRNDLYSVLDESLTRLKDRLNIYKSKMMKFQSLLELSGYRFDKNGDLIESDQIISIKQSKKPSSKKTTTTNKKTNTKKTTKAKVDLSAEDN